MLLVDLELDDTLFPFILISELRVFVKFALVLFDLTVVVGLVTYEPDVRLLADDDLKPLDATALDLETPAVE